MAKRKPAAKNWQERQIEDWNVTTFHAYLIDKHQERFGVPYYPFGSWIAEKKRMKDTIEQHGADVVKMFIDKCLSDYSPSPQYPGVNFGFMLQYMNRNLQQAIKGDAQQQARDKHREAMEELFKDDDDGDDLSWI